MSVTPRDLRTQADSAELLLAALAQHDDAHEASDVERDDLCGLRSREALLALSPARENAFCWYRVPQGARILELRCGNGGATGYFARNAKALICIAERADEARVCARRYGTTGSVEVLSGDLPTALDGVQGQFDLVVLHDLQAQDDRLLERVAEVLADDGALLLTASNALGVAELASVRMDGTGPFDLRGNDAPASGMLLLRSQIDNMLASAGLEVTDVYYPHPDHRFARYVFSDERLPDEGELTFFEDSSGVQRVRTLHEERLERAFLAQGAFPLVANSFFVVARRSQAARTAGNDPTSPVVYAKISSERAAHFALVTTVERGQAVHKRALLPEGDAHIQRILAAQDHLRDLFEADGLFAINRAWREEDSVRLGYLTGKTLEDQVASALGENRHGDALALLTEYRDRVLAQASGTFSPSEEFAQVFGSSLDEEALRQLDGMPCLPVTDVDLILRNIIPEGDAWHLIDYEWTFDMPVPVHFVLWRSLHYLLLTSAVAREAEASLGCWDLFGLDEQTRAVLLAMEDSFQAYVTGGTPPVDTVLRDCEPRPRDLTELWNESKLWHDSSLMGRLRHAKHSILG